MAQPITCDVHERQHLADVLVSQIATGDTMAACGPGYLELCRALVEAADAPEVEASTADALARLEGVVSDAGLPTSPESSAADDQPAEPPTSGARRPENAEPDADATPEPVEAPGRPSEGVGDPVAGEAPA